MKKYTKAAIVATTTVAVLCAVYVVTMSVTGVFASISTEENTRVEAKRLGLVSRYGELRQFEPNGYKDLVETTDAFFKIPFRPHVTRLGHAMSLIPIQKLDAAALERAQQAIDLLQNLAKYQDAIAPDNLSVFSYSSRFRLSLVAGFLNHIGHLIQVGNEAEAIKVIRLFGQAHWLDFRMSDSSTHYLVALKNLEVNLQHLTTIASLSQNPKAIKTAIREGFSNFKQSANFSEIYQLECIKMQKLFQDEGLPTASFSALFGKAFERQEAIAVSLPIFRRAMRADIARAFVIGAKSLPRSGATAADYDRAILTYNREVVLGNRVTKGFLTDIGPTHPIGNRIESLHLAIQAYLR
jgi:hypothetical protein